MHDHFVPMLGNEGDIKKKDGRSVIINRDKGYISPEVSMELSILLYNLSLT